VLIGVMVHAVAELKRTRATFQKSFAVQFPAAVPASARLVNVIVGVVLVVEPQKTRTVAIRPAERA